MTLQLAPQEALDIAFRNARTFNKFTDQPVTDETLREIVDLMKWGPTSLNSQAGRFVFLRSKESRERLRPALSAGNLEKTMAAPITVIVAIDNEFYEHLPTLFPAYDARPMFQANAAVAEKTGFRDGTLQGAYFIIAARMLGLDCGPMAGFDAAKVDAEFFPDGKWRTNFLINLGYGDAAGNYPRNPRLSFEQTTQIL
ncbi:malonic semialdehyde reductase [Uliginosibacterium sp. H3]|uniref:Putative NADH dehydrogenase/NAD(P)H nitroreductase VVD49_03185 n=1 Tax=Uliginosibacterium silvisoli TaxID=3114758 RepID=A0ABU6JZ65_9RHOO|nr:malonic semialdehyde reductase [Uliginosibacterium sp. H3]